MKKTILLAAAFGFALAGTAYAQNSITGSYNTDAGGGIRGSKHDLSIATGVGAKYGAVDTLDRICIYCHAPHHTVLSTSTGLDGANGAKYLPLWNRGVPTTTYTTYQSNFGEGPDASGEAGVGQVSNSKQFNDRHLFNGSATIQQPGSVSLLCLSCHDGSIAVNTYGQGNQRANSQNDGTAIIDAQFAIGLGGNLVNHHPIGFEYDDVRLVDDEIAGTWTAISAGGGSHSTTTIGSLLYAGRMECVTCHDVHNSKNTGETFLWTSDRNSGFCLTCHLK